MRPWSRSKQHYQYKSPKKLYFSAASKSEVSQLADLGGAASDALDDLTLEVNVKTYSANLLLVKSPQVYVTLVFVHFCCCRSHLSVAMCWVCGNVHSTFVCSVGLSDLSSCNDTTVTQFMCRLERELKSYAPRQWPLKGFRVCLLSCCQVHQVHDNIIMGWLKTITDKAHTNAWACGFVSAVVVSVATGRPILSCPVLFLSRMDCR